ncbi:MAG: homoserine O-acetyltransferase/O-succinyltransferase family protein, partial [Acetobacteraceae bacterium]
NEAHPFLPSLGDPAAIAADRAMHQDIRPLEIAILNLMADKQTTERQLAQWLGHTPLQVRLTFAATDDYVHGVRSGRETSGTPAEYIRKFYSAWSDIKERKFDGLLITGVNLLQADVTREEIWPQIEKIYDWSTTNVFSSLFLCWAAFAALRHFHGIECYNGETKTLGVFEHHILTDRTGLLFGLPDRFPVPVGRWQRLRHGDLRTGPSLEVISESAESGAFLAAEHARSEDAAKLYPRRVYMFNHPEYETNTIRKEYLRDLASCPELPLPPNYFPADDPSREPVNRWRHTAIVYINWVKAVYEATPYDTAHIPRLALAVPDGHPAGPRGAALRPETVDLPS